MTTRHESFDSHSDDDYARLLAAYHQSMLSGDSDNFDVEDAVEMSGAMDALRMMERNRQLTDNVDNDATIPEPISLSVANSEDDVAVEERCIGRFQILKRLGAGGGGVVMLARDPQLQRKVALKVPNPDALMRDEFVERFQREARVAAGLKHPNIVKVLETGAVGPICYIATDYCNGPNLSQWLKEHAQPVSPLAAARLVRALADATQHAHSRGVLHRDIKPSNILFEIKDAESESHSYEDEVEGNLNENQLADSARLADFGLAKQINDSVNVTAPAAVVGTPAYMSPEQASGELSEAGTHSDTFSLGVVLYELLTGESPFARESALSTLQAVRHHEPKRPRALNTAVPTDLDAICYRSIEKRSTDRYGTAAALVEDLDNFIDGRPVSARNISTAGRVWRWAKRNPILAGLLSTVAILLAALVIGSSYAAIEINQERDKALDELEARIRAYKTVVEKEKAALGAVYEARVAHAQSLRRTGEAGQRTESLKSLRKAVALMDELELGPEAKAELRSAAIAAMSLPDLTRETEWTGPTNNLLLTRADESCQRYARPGEDGRRIEICDARSNKVLQTLELRPGRFVMGGFLFSPDGRHLVTRYREGKNTDSTATLWDITTAKPIVDFNVSRPPAKVLGRVHIPYDFNSAGTELCVVRGKNLRILNPIDGAEVEKVRLPNFASTVRFSPNGQRVGIGLPRSVLILERKSLSEISAANTRPTIMSASRIAWSDDSSLLAAAIDRKVQIWNTRTGNLQTTLGPHGRKVIEIDFHPDNETVMTLAGDATTHLWDASGGNSLLQWPEMLCTHFSPDGKYLASREGLLRFNSAKQSRMDSPNKTLPPGQAAKSPPLRTHTSWACFHPGGRLLVRGNGTHVSFFDVASGKPICRVRAPIGQCFFSQDGNSLFGLSFKEELIRFAITTQESAEATTFNIAALGDRVPTTEIPDRWPTATPGQAGAYRFGIVQGLANRLLFLDRQSGTYHQLATNKVGGNWASIVESGNIAATASRSENVRLWDLTTGDVLQEFDLKRARVKFQPNSDNPLLAVTTMGGLKLYGKSPDTNRWAVTHQQGGPLVAGLPTYMTFTPSGRYLAYRRTRKVIDLIDTSNFETVASVTVPDGTMAAEIYFSPDGSHMMVGTNEGYFHVWALSEIGEQLDDMQLGLEDLSPAPRHESGKIEVDWKPDFPK